MASFTDAQHGFDEYVPGNAVLNIAQEIALMPPSTIQLGSLDGLNGFTLHGIATGDRSGRSVAAAGDVNGDGFEDLLIGAPYASEGGVESGGAYVVFGQSSGLPAEYDLSTLNGVNGFRMSGVAAYDYAGRSVASAGDVNGDGFADIIVGAWGADPNGDLSGASYVVFGAAGGFGALLDLGSLDGSNGFRLEGVASGDYSGLAVASAGDLNGDGFADLVIGAERTTSSGGFAAGTSYVVFGKAGGFAASIELASLDGSDGFALDGVGNRAYSGSAVASAGDVNGDGFADLIIGARYADPTGDAGYAGAAYVLFGTAAGFAAQSSLAGLDGSNGFRLVGAVGYGGTGVSVGSAGDVNGDGFDDVIVGAYRADANGIDSGESYVVFGKAGGFGADFDLALLDGSNGFRIDGVATEHNSGRSVASAGDINGDGFADLIIGADGADPNGAQSGQAYVVFGKATGFAAVLELSALDGTDGFSLDGVAAGDHAGIAVSAAGDLNGDGFDDLVVGADQADPHGSSSGASYVLYGSAFGAAVVTTGTGAADLLVGGSGDDVLKGRGGADVFNGGAGNDVLTIGDLAFRRIDGGTGIDTLKLGAQGLALDVSSRPPVAPIEGIERIDMRGAGPNILTVDARAVLNGLGTTAGGLHVLTVLGNSDDAVHLVEPGWTKTGSLKNAEGTFDRYRLGNAEVDVRRTVSVPGASILGTAGKDLIDADSTPPGQPLPTNRDDTINGLGGNDTISALAGDDTVLGSGGNDRLDGGPGNDLLNGGDGIDTASYASAGAGVRVSLALATEQNTLGAGRDTLIGLENLEGSAFDDRLTGDAGANLLIGLDGDDVLTGGGGADTLRGGKGTDTASYAGAAAGVVASLADASTNTGDAAGDVYQSIANLTGSKYADVLIGSSAANQLDGGRGDDVLDGGSGNDRLLGSGGHDTLTGGVGNDTFVFDQALSAGNLATIADFDHVHDTIALSLAVFGAAGPAGTLAGAAFQLGSVALQADDRILYDPTSGLLRYDFDGTGAGAAQTFAVLGTGLPVKANDFQLF